MIAVDLFCGLGGWTEGLLAEGWYVVGFDIERHVYGEHRYPAQLVLQDALTLHGSQFRNVDLIVASPPCQGYSYRAMPWSKAKALPPPDNSLFEACFRIQSEACEAAGRHIPLIVENVRGAQKWVGRSRWNYGSFHLWGDVPALMPMTAKMRMKSEIVDVRHPGCANFHQSQAMRAQIKSADGTKHHASGSAWFDGAPDKMLGHFGPAKFGSKSKARKVASALIAKIPLPLSRYIAATFKPVAA